MKIMVPFVIALKRMKYLEINLTKEVKDTYNDIYKIFVKKKPTSCVHGLEYLILGGGRCQRPLELQPPFPPFLPTLCSSPCLDLLLTTWWECFWLKTMTYQTWLKNLKKLQKTWMLRRNPLVAEADSSTAFWINWVYCSPGPPLSSEP